MTPPTLQDFYQEVANPLLTAVTFEYPNNAVEEVTQDNFRLFFKGSEMVVAGKLQAQSPEVLSAQVSGKLVRVDCFLEWKGGCSRHSEGLGSNSSHVRLQPTALGKFQSAPVTVDDLSPHCIADVCVAGVGVGCQ